MILEHAECPSEVFLYVRDHLNVGFKVGYPEVAKPILGEVFEGAQGHPN